MRRVWVCYSIVCLAAAVLGWFVVAPWFAAFTVGQAVVQMIPAFLMLRWGPLI